MRYLIAALSALFLAGCTSYPKCESQITPTLFFDVKSTVCVDKEGNKTLKQEIIK